MSMFGKFAKLGTARELLHKAQRYAQQNPDKVRRYTDKAAAFADKQTKGRYSQQIDKAVRKADDFTGQGRQGGQRGEPYPGSPGGQGQPPGGSQPGGSQPGGQQSGGQQPGGQQSGGQQSGGQQPGGEHRRDDRS